MDEVTIARLVLGYLREEGCRSAYKDFLKVSRHLQASKFSSSKYVPTRFVGLTLNDILKEYFEIYQTVQGRLEATNYYREPHCTSSLTHQLLYLLNDGRQSSRASTPCFRSPGDSHFGETSPVYTDHVSDVEATPAHKLPGNTRYDSEESDVSNLYRNKNRSRSSDDLHDSFATDKDVSTEVILNTEILAQTLLENKELPEKIAQTINKVAEKNHRISTELDETIQTVVKETAQDPIFDKILEEIIGSANLMESMRVSDHHSVKNHHSQNEVVTSCSKNVQKKVELKEHREKQVDKISVSVEEQTAEAIQSLIETTKNIETQPQPQQQPQPQPQQQTQPQPQQAAHGAKSDVIVFDGSLDKYILSNSCTIPTPVHQPQTPFVLNANGNLLMVPSTIPTIPTNITSTPTNQYYIINKPPVYNCYIPTSTVLTEKDILAMPTVIVSDDRPAVSDTNSKGRPKEEIKIQPKPPVESSPNESLAEFLTLHKGDNDSKSVTKVVTTVSETNSQANKSCDEKESGTKGPSINSKTSEAPPDQVDTNNPLEENIAKAEPACTPTQTLNTKKTTPKSGSHVRNLDFSTPPRITSTHKKSLRNAKSEKKNTESKKQAAKMLFKKEKSSDGKKKAVDALPWDANLRTFVPTGSDKRSPRKRKNTKPKRKKRTNENEDLNTTEQDAALLEAALKTPVKNDAKEDKEIASEKKIEPETREISPKITMKECSVVVMDDDIDKNRILKEMTGEGQKTVLSPSKLNANKRNIVNTASENNDTFITPETIHDTVAYPLKANRNIIPMLETPVKATLPKTPGIETPSEFNLSSLSNFTPVAKMLEANLPGFDINLPTPNLPITPSFPPFTPTADLLSPYSNRPTDYSTSSSYYQPSDNEQNKSLEAQLLEVEKKQISDETKSDVSTNQHLTIFNKNVIGKKNLNLVKRNETTFLSSASSSSSSDKSEDENEAWTERESNDTVICKKKSQETPRKTYALRNRSISGKNLTPKLSVEKESSSMIETQSPVTKQVQPKVGSKTPKKKTTRSEEPQEPSTSSKNNQGNIKEAPSVKHIKGRSAAQEAVFKELEEKRQRTINKFKTVENSTGAKAKKNNGKFMKIKPIANLSNHKRKTKKIDSPKKNVLSKNDSSLLNTLRQDLADSEDETEDDISLRLSVSEDDENIQSNIDKKLKKEEEKIRSNIDKKLKRVEKIEKSASDVEAQTLIEGLRERGIHLMHNKNTKNPNSSSKTEQEFPKTESSEINDAKAINNSNSETEVAINNSGPCLNYSLREELDTCLLTEEICITYSEHDPIKKPQEDFNINLQIEKLTAKVYIDEIDKEVDITYTLTEYNTILDINPLKVNEETSDDKTKDKEECLSGSQSPSSSKKRKYEDEEANDHKEKKCKTLLNKINLDNFLTNIHGNK